jgi:hypothetical protein
MKLGEFTRQGLHQWKYKEVILTVIMKVQGINHQLVKGGHKKTP